MVLDQIAESLQETKDSIGSKDNTRDMILDRNNEKLLIEENSTRVMTNTIGNSWIVGSTTNGIVGTNTGTQGGGQQVVGASGRSGEVVIRVINPNNNFREHFRDTTFKDTDALNTADWNTTLFRLAMTTKTDKSKAYNTIATSHTIFTNSKTVSKATFNATETKWGSDVIKYYLSADGGASWEEVTLGIEHIFTNTGTDLKFRVIFIGNGANNTYSEDINISYVAS